MPALPHTKASTPERLIAGIGAGLSLGLMMEIVLVAWEGSAYMTGGVSGYWCGSRWGGEKEGNRK